LRTSRLSRLAVDANPILSALIGGAALRVFQACPERVGELATTEHTVREVLEYIPELAKKPRVQKAGISEADLYFALVTAPLTIYTRGFYEEELEAAHKEIGERDPEDVDLLALALKLNAPIWSNDQHFRGLKVKWWTTARLLLHLGLES